MELPEAGAVFAFRDNGNIEGWERLSFHRCADDPDRFVFMTVIHLEKQFIMDLQNRANIRLILELTNQFAHGQLQNLRCRALNRCIECHAFAQLDY